MSIRVRSRAADTVVLILAILIPSVATSSPTPPQDIPPGVLTARRPINNEQKPLTESDVISLLKDDVPPSRVGEIARDRKIDFQVTGETERKIRLAGGDGDLVRILRQLAEKGSGFLFVASEPLGAQVTLDGDPIGVTPLTQENVKSGPHRLVVTRPSYHSRVLNVVVEPNVVTRSIVEFEKLLSVSVETDFDFGTLSVDDQPIGPVKPTQRVPLAAGVHTFRLQDSQMSVDISQQVDVGESDQRVFFLKADYLGNLTILSGVAIEKLTVNGRSFDSPAVTVRDISAGSATVCGTSGPTNHVFQNAAVVAGETAILRFAVGDLKSDPPPDVCNVVSSSPPPPSPTLSSSSGALPRPAIAAPPPVVRTSSNIGAPRGKAAGIVEFTAYSGATFFDPSNYYYYGPSYNAPHWLPGGSVAVSLNRWLWLYGDYSHSSLGTVVQSPSTGFTETVSERIDSFHLGARVEFLENTRFSPFINFGGGLMHNHSAYTDVYTPPYSTGTYSGSYGSIEASWRGGIGTRIRLTPRWGIRFAVETLDYRFGNEPFAAASAGFYFQTRPTPGTGGK